LCLPKGKVVDVVLSEYLHPCTGEVSAQLLYQGLQAVLQAPHCPILCPKVKTGVFTCVHMKTSDQLPSQPVLPGSVTFWCKDPDPIPDPIPDPTPFFIELKDAKNKYFFFIFFSQVHHLQSKNLIFC
jgi:hypothetical protein